MQRSRSSAIVGEIGIGFSNVRFAKVIRVFPEPRLVAEHRDLDPRVERGLDQPESLRHLDLDVVYRDRDELVRTHAEITASGFSTTAWWCCSDGARIPSIDD